MRRLLLLLVCAPSLARAAAPITRDDIARHYAPIIFQEAHDPIKDLFTAFDFDGDWNGDNQAENMECWSDSSKCNTSDNPNSPCTGQKCPLIATVYYTVIETQTHWFVQYMPYHPLDWKVTNGHENDTESILMVISKTTGYGALQAMETRFHDVWYQYSNDSNLGDSGDNVDGPVHFDMFSGRPAVYSQMVGHGICGGFSPPNYVFPDLQLTCNHNDTPHVDTTGIKYSPDMPAQMPITVDNIAVDAGYSLVELLTSVWPHIHDIGAGKTFLSNIDYTGERCAMFTCPTQFGGDWEGNEGQSPGEPWAQEGGNGVSQTGDQFFDPAYTMSKRLSFPAPFSLVYCFNPYLGVADTCGDGAPDGGAPVDLAVAGDLASGGHGGAGGSGGQGGSSGGSVDAGPLGASPGGCGCHLAAQPVHSFPSGGLVVASLLLSLFARRYRGAGSTTHGRH